MKVKIIGLIVGFTMALSLGVTAFAAISNVYNEEASGLDSTRLAAASIDNDPATKSGVHQAFTFVCPFH